MHSPQCMAAEKGITCHPVYAAGGSKRGSQVNYVRQTPKFLQAHAHLLGRGGQPPAPGAEGAPEGATIAALEDEPPEDDWDDDGVRAHAGWSAQRGRVLRLLCCVQWQLALLLPAGRTSKWVLPLC